MAGDWIKMRHSVASDPAVIAVASRLGLDEDAVVGKLHRLWSWFDIHTFDGHAASVTTSWLDVHVRCDGMCAALSQVGWLLVDETGVSMPNFDRHNGDCAKSRALAAERKRKQRQKKRDDASAGKSVTKKSRSQRDKSVTRGEERREEKNKGVNPLKPPAEAPPEFDCDEFRQAFERWTQHRVELKKPLTPTAIAGQLKRLYGMGLTRALAAIEYSIRGGWQGIFEEKPDDNHRRPQSRHPSEPGPGQRYDPAATPSGVF